MNSGQKFSLHNGASETQYADRATIDLEIYLSNSSQFRSQIYDHREIQCIADHFGLSTERVRSELKRLGYQLINNGHGRKIWKSREGEHVNFTKKIASLEEYISKYEARQMQFYDKSEIGRIANRIGVGRDSVRAVLRRKGYKLTTNVHGIPVWIKKSAIPISAISIILFNLYLDTGIELSKL